jgi:flagellar motor protein MotB
MKRMSLSMGVLLALLALLMLPACDSSKDIQIAELQKQVDDLLAERGSLESRLASALKGGDQARQTALSLQQQLDEARRQLAERGGAAEGEWVELANAAWLSLGTDILFDSGKATLKPQGVQKLAAAADTIKSKYAGRRIFVLGYTDTDPIKVTKNLWIDNLDLSLNRAATVTRELEKLGVPGDLVVAGGQGQYNPRAPNDTRENKAKNRRVEIVAIESRG